MGSYTEFSVDGYSLVQSKSYAIPEVLAVFRESDKRVGKRKFSGQNLLVWGEPKPEGDELESVVLYQASVRDVAQRLDVMGFTLRRAEDDFEQLRIKHLEELKSIEDETDDPWIDSRHLIEGLTFTVFVEALTAVMFRGLRGTPFADRDRPDLSAAERYVLDDNEDYLLGYYCSDMRFLIRVACSLVDPNSVVEQDLTDVVIAGYYQEDETVAEDAVRTLTNDYPANAKIIIITEGSSDATILREALLILYPHLVDFYSFFDFEASRAAGGASQVVTVVKAFIAAGISNKVIALFDNDTAAREAVRPLQRVTLPINVAVLHYPVLESLRCYPTIGPTGTIPFDVNGVAGSIELYLGDDILGSDHPVQWRGFSETMHTYQGEVMHKGSLQQKFLKKSESCKSDPKMTQKTDWSGLDQIWRSIFQAFD